MINVEDLKLLNKSKLEYLKKVGGDYNYNQIISEILEDKACFFKIQKKDATNILKHIGIQADKIDETYTGLTSIDEFYYLIKCGYIKADDVNLIIKYKMYDNDVFKIESTKFERTKELSTHRKNIIEVITKKIKKLLKEN